MCGTKNSSDATTCKSCGYVFEKFNTSEAGSYSEPEHQDQPVPSFESSPVSSAPTPTPTISTGGPLFVVTRSVVGSLLPLIIYLLFIAFSGLIFSVYFVGIIAIFVLITVVPMLTSPRRYEFYSDSLRLHKIVGGDSEVFYSNMTLYESPRGRQIGLLVEGQRRPIMISGNPVNAELNQNLKQFLEKKVKKPESKPTSEPTTSETDASDASDDSSYSTS